MLIIVQNKETARDNINDFPKTSMVNALEHMYRDLPHTYMRGKISIDNMLVIPALLKDKIIIRGGYLPVYQRFLSDNLSSSSLSNHRGPKV